VDGDGVTLQSHYLTLTGTGGYLVNAGGPVQRRGAPLQDWVTFEWPVRNDGGAAVLGSIQFRAYLEGQEVGQWFSDPQQVGVGQDVLLLFPYDTSLLLNTLHTGRVRVLQNGFPANGITERTTSVFGTGDPLPA
jgi:hypothetical protein